MTGASGAQLVDAVAVGIEVVVRLGMAGYDLMTRNSVFFEHGQHATSICGAMGGAAVASALLLDLAEEGTTHALGIAASMASGILEANRTGGMVKRLHCGWAAHAGVTAAPWCNTASPERRRRWRADSASSRPSCTPTATRRRLSKGWAATGRSPASFFKPYPANHFTHTGIDATRRMRRQGLRPRDVESAVLGVASPTVRTIGQPLEVKQAPDTGYQAQFSGPYTVTAGLFGGGGLGVGLDDFTDELARDPDRRAVMGRVTVQDAVTDVSEMTGAMARPVP